MSMLPNIPLVVGLYALFFEGVFQVGKALYVMTFIRNREVEYESLFEGFMLYVKAFMVALIQTLIVAGWSLLFIIPGVIAKYGFSQSYFILADDPKKGVMQCLAESKLRMTGNKAMLFMLDLSYLPYLMLGAVPQVIAGAFIALDTTTIAGTIGLIILDIPMVLASGIVALGHGAFYELLLRHGFKNFKFANQGVFRSLGLNDDDDDTVEFDN